MCMKIIMNIHKRFERFCMENKHYFYVLECRDNTLYAGYTNHLERRIAAHNAKKGAKYTKPRTPVTCIHYEVFETKQEAMRQDIHFCHKPFHAAIKLLHFFDVGEFDVVNPCFFMS